MKLRNLFLAVLLCFLGPCAAYPAWLFDSGGTDNVAISDSDVLTLPNSDWTVRCTVKLSTNTLVHNNDARVITWDGGHILAILLQDGAASATGEVRYRVDTGTLNQCDSTTGPFTGNLSQTDVTIMRSGSNILGYVNDSQMCSVAFTGASAINANTSFYFGNRADNLRPFPGDIAECAAWHRALSTAELAGLAAGFSPTCYPGLVWYTPAIESYRELRNNLTVTNSGTTISAHLRTIYCGE